MRLFTLLVIFFISCNSIENKTYVFSDFIEVNEIEKVIMNNYSGSFELNETQLTKFKKEISTLTYNSSSVKLGAISFEIFINSKSYFLYSDSKSTIVEIPKSIFTKNISKLNLKFGEAYFNTNGINFQNYSQSK